MSATLFKDVKEIITMDDERRRLKDHDMLVRDGKIAALEPEIELPDDLDRSEVEIISGDDHFIFPGLINTHHHFYQSLTRNIREVQDVELFDWLTSLYPLWSHLTPEAVYYSTLVAGAELLKTGCTTSVDQFYVFPRQERYDLLDEEFRAAEKLGLRLHACRGSMSLGQEDGGLPPDEVVQTEEEILQDTRRVIEEFHDPEPFARSRVVVSPCSPFSVTRRLMEESIELAREYGVMAHTHLAETEDEDEFCQEKFGLTPLEYMKDVGWIGPDVWFAHGVHLDQEEIEELAAHETGVAHCPTSNMKLSSGVASVPDMLEAGMPLGLAVDGSASNDASNMRSEMKTALLLHKLSHGITSVGPEDILEMATRGGSEMLKQPETGSLAEGQAADLFLLDSRRLALAGGLSDPVSALINTGIDHGVDMTMVAGEIVVRGGRLETISEREIAARANKIADDMLAEEGMKP